MIRKLRVKLVCILMALLTVMLGVTFGLVLHFTQQSLEAESLRTLEALANNWQTASSPGLDDGTRVPYFALEINARGDIITTRGGYFDLSDREKLQKLIDIAVNSEDDIGEVPDYGLRFYRVVTRTSWRVVFADTSAETTTLPSTCPYDQLCEQEIQNHSCSCAAKTSSNVGMDLFSVHIAEQKQQKICQQEQTKVIKARLIARKAHDQKQCSLYDRFSKICGTNHTLCRQNRKQK